jgi:hypothetical protein
MILCLVKSLEMQIAKINNNSMIASVKGIGRLERNVQVYIELAYFHRSANTISSVMKLHVEVIGYGRRPKKKKIAVG